MRFSSELGSRVSNSKITVATAQFCSTECSVLGFRVITARTAGL